MPRADTHEVLDQFGAGYFDIRVDGHIDIDESNVDLCVILSDVADLRVRPAEIPREWWIIDLPETPEWVGFVFPGVTGDYEPSSCRGLAEPRVDAHRISRL